MIIPALDEELALPGVLAALPQQLVDTVTVVDNGSSDDTAGIAASWGARVVREPRRGYGAACMAGIEASRAAGEDDIIVFLDADGSTDPGELGRLIEPILTGAADFVMGSRTLTRAAAAAIPPHARAGNALALRLIALATGARFTDLGPFRALRLGALRSLRLRDRDFGWNVEMQMRAVRSGLVWREIAVAYRPRAAGRSKISGTALGSVRAGCKMLWTVARHAG